MNVRIFYIVNDEIEVSPHVLLIPEFAALKATYKDYKKILAGLHYLCFPDPEDNPYYNVDEELKPAVIKKDYFDGTDLPGLNDPVFVKAMDKMKFLYNSTILKFHMSHKALMDKMITIQSSEVKEWPENMKSVQDQLSKAGIFVEQFIKSQKAASEELTKVKGDLEEGYDEGRLYPKAL